MSCTQQGTSYHRPREGQREQVALSCPIAEYGQHVLPPNPCAIYPREISCEGRSTYPRPLEPIASSQIDGRPTWDELGRTCIHNGKEKEETASHNTKHGCVAT